MGDMNDLMHVVTIGKADAVAMAHVLHYKKYAFHDIRRAALGAGLPVRRL